MNNQLIYVYQYLDDHQMSYVLTLYREKALVTSVSYRYDQHRNKKISELPAKNNYKTSWFYHT